MPLIVGLGNPGKEYSGTPHNIGFEVIERLARRWGLQFKRSRVGKAEEAKRAGSPPILIFRPLAFMNLSGSPVADALRWHNFKTDELLVVCDDVNLPPGYLRFRLKGGSGGQKGLHSIIEYLGTEEFHRLRIGVGGGQPGADVGEYVLNKPSTALRTILAEAAERAADAVECYINDGIETAMNRFNTSRIENETDDPSGEDRLPDKSSPKGEK
ncbi:MAG: aminoacyl-tRNA hydrolase [Calditrichota bacterium]